MSPCSNPIVLPGAAVQTFILPYTAERPLSGQARSLVTTLQRHVLFAALKYSSIAVEELVDDAHCNTGSVIGSVLSRLEPNQTALFMGGRMFEQQGTVYLESWVRVSRAAADSLVWRFEAGEGNTLAVQLSMDTITFAPRAIPIAILGQLEFAQRQMQRVHRSPDPKSSYWDLPSSADARYSFFVLGTSGDWMHVRLFQSPGVRLPPEGRLPPSSQEGWIEAHALADGNDLKGQFPELYFIDGLIGYHLLARAAPPTAPIGGRTLAEYVRASFSRYLEFTNARPETEARATAHILSGNALLSAAGPGPWPSDVLKAAQAEYSIARTVAPSSTLASNFYLACTTALCARGECAAGADQLHSEYLTAIGRDPTSRELLENLATLYRAADRGKLTLALTGQALAAQQTRLETATRALK